MPLATPALWGLVVWILSTAFISFPVCRCLMSPENSDPQFHLEHRGPVSMKGKKEPMQVWFLSRKNTGLEVWLIRASLLLFLRKKIKQGGSSRHTSNDLGMKRILACREELFSKGRLRCSTDKSVTTRSALEDAIRVFLSCNEVRTKKPQTHGLGLG